MIILSLCETVQNICNTKSNQTLRKIVQLKQVSQLKYEGSCKSTNTTIFASKDAARITDAASLKNIYFAIRASVFMLIESREKINRVQGHVERDGECIG